MQLMLKRRKRESKGDARVGGEKEGEKSNKEVYARVKHVWDHMSTSTRASP